MSEAKVGACMRYRCIEHMLMVRGDGRRTEGGEQEQDRKNEGRPFSAEANTDLHREAAVSLSRQVQKSNEIIGVRETSAGARGSSSWNRQW